MSVLPPIFVINREKDRARKKAAVKNYASAKLAPIFLDAVDGHGKPKELAPYTDFLADSFWGKPDIKPGAFACFMSHRNAWRKIIDDDLPFAIIAEDDAIPDQAFTKQWGHIERQIDHADIVFLNNRMAQWPQTHMQDIDDCIQTRIANKNPDDLEFRAPGADGYFLTQSGAEILLKASQEEGVYCGVDWFMLACAWNSVDAKHGEIKEHVELKKIWKHRGGQEPLLQGKVSKTALFSIDRDLASSINHSERVEISVFRSQLLG